MQVTAHMPRRLEEQANPVSLACLLWTTLKPKHWLKSFPFSTTHTELCNTWLLLISAELASQSSTPTRSLPLSDCISCLQLLVWLGSDRHNSVFPVSVRTGVAEGSQSLCHNFLTSVGTPRCFVFRILHFHVQSDSLFECKCFLNSSACFHVRATLA